MSEKKVKASKNLEQPSKDTVTEDLKGAYEAAPQILQQYIATKEQEVMRLSNEVKEQDTTITVLIRKLSRK